MIMRLPRLISARRFSGLAVRTHPRNGDRVVVAMSGGVDSSVAARLLTEKDYDLSAVFMRNWDTRDESGTETGCEWEKDWEDVQRVCTLLDIPCKMVDLSRQYWTRVFEPALDEWAEGLTPNPDVSCNREIKFGALMDRALTTPNQWLATGHYAQLRWDTLDPTHARPMLYRSADRHKDQTYYLSSVPESQLHKALFPIGHLTKPEVRELATRYSLPTASRSESMGICFVGEKGHFNQFLSQYIPPKPGRIVDTNGKDLGAHRGLWMYTIGQGARIPGLTTKMFVARKDAAANELVVAPSDHPSLFCTSVFVSSWHWIWDDHPPSSVDSPTGLRASVQIRHRMSEVPCTIFRRKGGVFEIRFEQPEQGVAPGQIAVVWDGEWCLGSGKIVDTTCLE